MSRPALNFALYQLGWFGCVLGAAHGFALWGAALGAFATVLHLRMARQRRPELTLVLWAMAMGVVVDTFHQATGLLRYASPLDALPWLAPPWIVVLWAQFATTLRHSLRWLTLRPWLAPLLGALLGPLAFRAGEALGAVDFAPTRWPSYLSLAVAWGAALPVLVRLARGGQGTNALVRST